MAAKNHYNVLGESRIRTGLWSYKDTVQTVVTAEVLAGVTGGAITGAGAIAGAGAAGSPGVGLGLSCAGGVATAQMAGSHLLSLGISAAGGVSSVGAIGAPSMALELSPVSIPSAQAWGLPLVQVFAGIAILSPAGIPSAESWGRPLVAFPVGIVTARIAPPAHAVIVGPLALSAGLAEPGRLTFVGDPRARVSVPVPIIPLRINHA